MRPVLARVCAVFVFVSGAALAIPANAQFVPFESGMVRGLAHEPSNGRLLAVNTPDNRLEVYDTTASGLRHRGSVAVGLEPVAVALRNANEAWVANHLSDSISIVDLSASPPRVVRTLLVGDEPRDIVFAGPGGNRAFITTAHRGQNSPSAVDPFVEATGRADIWVFDATTLGAEAGGNPLTVLTLFGDTPRPLAVSPDGSTVYAGIFHSGNQTTVIFESVVESQGLLPPATNHAGDPAPPVSTIVKFNPGAGTWIDAIGGDWTADVPFSLPDFDVFAINANATPPVQTASFAGVGTILFNMAVNPANGKLYVTNGDARSEVRFEGPGVFAGTQGIPGPLTVRGRLHEYRITIVDPNAGTVEPRHLNNHLDYGLDPAATEASGAKVHSLATPLEMVFRSDGSQVFVSAFGSSKVGVFDPAALEANTFDPNAANQIAITGGGPSGLALDEAANRLYVLARFDNTISVVDVSTAPGAEIAIVPMPHNPEPPSVRDGRPFLYDAQLTSANGEASCSSCHIFARMDDLSWDLGNPDGDEIFNANVQGPLGDILQGFDNMIAFLDVTGALPAGFTAEFHPMKGPMLTQSLRGLDFHGPMHWRGDRSGGGLTREDPNSLDENAGFNKFIVAFEGLLGRSASLTTPEMQTFTDFVLQIPYPPNPVRALDNSLNPSEQNGSDIFNIDFTDAVSPTFQGFTCNDCHALDVPAGFFGTNGDSSFDGETQMFKIPHLRNIYQRMGMFGITGDGSSRGDQIRGFGVLHDGSVDNVLSFVQGAAFTFPGANPAEILQNQTDVANFMVAFDTNFAPVMGQQVQLPAGAETDPLIPSSSDTTGDRLTLLESREVVTVPVPECDLVAKGHVDGRNRGWVRGGGGNYTSDHAGETAIDRSILLAAAALPGNQLVFTCVPPGSGTRIGIDRDGDGVLDGNTCGDSNDDGVRGAGDVDALRERLAAGAAASIAIAAPDKCNVIGATNPVDGDGDGVPDDCDIADVVALRRDLAALLPGAAPVCAAAAL